MENSWQVKIEWDGEDAILPLPQEVLDHLDLKEGDNIQWIDKGDDYWEIRKLSFDSDNGLTENL
jgi:hypothetical protein